MTFPCGHVSLFALRLLIILYSSIVFVTLASPQTRRSLTSNNMAVSFEHFCDSIGLSASQAHILSDRFNHPLRPDEPSQSKVEAACLAAELCLGEGQVDSAPLNQTLVEQNWSQACVKEPHCIIRPSSADDVSKAVQIIRYYEAAFATRSGGHSPNPGWSSIGQAGILLDLSRMNQVSLSSDKKVASLGPGGSWGDVISTLDAQGAMVIGGRIPQVGVGGLILGGGLSHFSGEYGMAADNVKNFEVVLSDGTITNANSDQNADLFWALKGGGPNFGIVTRFDLFTVPIREIWYRVAIHPVDQASDLIDAFVQWQNGGASDVKSTIGLVLGLDSIFVGLVYSTPLPDSADPPDIFAPFYAPVPLVAPVPGANGTVAALTALLGSTDSDEHLRHDYRAVSTGIDAQLYKDVFAFWREKALAVRESTGANQTFSIQPIPRSVAEQGEQKGGNPMGIPKVDHQWWTTLVDWKDAADDDTVRSVSIDTAGEWQRLAQERGKQLPYLFMNDAAREQNPLASYGTENVQKLKAISEKYDKVRMFQKQQNDGFLLSKV